MTLYPYRELTITSKVQECCGREFAAKLGEFDSTNSATTVAYSCQYYWLSCQYNCITTGYFWYFCCCHSCQYHCCCHSCQCHCCCHYSCNYAEIVATIAVEAADTGAVGYVAAANTVISAIVTVIVFILKQLWLQL